jgi:alpha-amylase/alpha-mannosidase (GH57 family)
VEAIIIYKFHFDRITRPFTFFDLGEDEAYFDEELTRDYFARNYKQYALPIFEKLISDKNAKISCYFSGVFLEFIQEHTSYLSEIKKLVKRGQIELLAGTYYHSLSSLFSASLFKIEVQKHVKMLEDIFDTLPIGFYNTANIYSNHLSEILGNLGFKAVLVPKIPWFQGDRGLDRIFQSVSKDISLVLVGDVYHIDEPQNHLGVYGLDGMSNNSVEILSDTKIKPVGFADSIRTNSKRGVYNLQETVALDFTGQDISYLIGNSLQKEYFRRVKEVSLSAHSKKNQSLTELSLSLASANHFRSIGRIENENDRNRNYRQLLNCLTDLGLRLRG